MRRAPHFTVYVFRERVRTYQHRAPPPKREPSDRCRDRVASKRARPRPCERFRKRVCSIFPAGYVGVVGLTIPPPADHLEPDVLPSARQRGFELVERELDTGQVVWAWQPADDAPAPLFLTRREALAWMADYLDRTTTPPDL